MTEPTTSGGSSAPINSENAENSERGDSASGDTGNSRLVGVESRSYSAIVWDQFKRYKLSYVSLAAVIGLFILAVAVPVLALNVPFFLYVPDSLNHANVPHGLSFPWLRALLDRNTTRTPK